MKQRPHKMDDQKIIDAIQKRQNKQVVRQLYQTCFPKVLSFITKNGGTKDEARDCFQEAVLGLIETIRKNRFNAAYEMEGYLFGAARNQWYMELRRKGRQATFSFDKDFTVSHEEPLVRKEKGQLFHSLLESLGERCAKLMRLMVYEGRKYPEVVQELGFGNVDVAKTTFYRCKERLRKKVQEKPHLTSLLRDA